jgi:branched-chain amino acid transport system substrate-binding protein
MKAKEGAMTRPEGRRFFDEYKQRYGVSSVDPYAIYGYEAMDLVLDSCEGLGPDCADRQALIDALRETQGRESVLGTYDIDENGDTTITDYGVYRVADGELVFDETVKAGQ